MRCSLCPSRSLATCERSLYRSLLTASWRPISSQAEVLTDTEIRRLTIVCQVMFSLGKARPPVGPGCADETLPHGLPAGRARDARASRLAAYLRLSACHGWRRPPDRARTPRPQRHPDDAPLCPSLSRPQARGNGGPGKPVFGKKSRGFSQHPHGHPSEETRKNPSNSLV